MAELDPWLLWWAIGGATALVAGLLLVGIGLATAAINRDARRVREALRTIDANTRNLSTLERTSKRFNTIRNCVEMLERNLAEFTAAHNRERFGRQL